MELARLLPSCLLLKVIPRQNSVTASYVTRVWNQWEPFCYLCLWSIDLCAFQDGALEVPDNKDEWDARYEAACCKLATEAVRKLSGDNVTAVVVSIEHCSMQQSWRPVLMYMCVWMLSSVEGTADLFSWIYDAVGEVEAGHRVWSPDSVLSACVNCKQNHCGTKSWVTWQRPDAASSCSGVQESQSLCTNARFQEFQRLTITVMWLWGASYF